MKLNRQTVRSVHGSLLLVCWLFIGTTVYELVRPYPVSPVSAILNREKTQVLGTGAITKRDVPPRSAFAEIVERPLFREDRRPHIPETPAEPGQQPETGPDITALISLSAVERIALVERKQDRKLQQLRQGEIFIGWAVNHIRADDIIMQKGQETRQIALTVTPPPPASGKPQSEPETMSGNSEEQTGAGPKPPTQTAAGKAARRKPAPRQ